MTLSSVFNPQELWGLLEREKAVSAEYAASCLEDYPEAEILKQLKAWEKQGKLLLDGGYYCLPPVLNPALLKKAQKALKQAKSLDALLCCLKLNCGMDEAAQVLESLATQGKAERRGDRFYYPETYDHDQNQSLRLSENLEDARPAPTDPSSDRPETRSESRGYKRGFEGNQGLAEDRPSAVSESLGDEPAGDTRDSDSQDFRSHGENDSHDTESRNGWIVYTKPGNSPHQYFELRWYKGGKQRSKYIPGGNVTTAAARANREEVGRALAAGKSTREICELIDTFKGGKR